MRDILKELLSTRFILAIILVLSIQVFAFAQDVPEPITNLKKIDITTTSVRLSWTAPVGEGGVGYVARYDVRYSTIPITSENFDSATPAFFWRTPGSLGPTELFPISNLSAGTTYYFAIKSSFFLGEWSALSNVLQVSTDLPPAIHVSSQMLSDSLVMAITSTHNITIYNTGPGTLEFYFDIGNHLIPIIDADNWYVSIPSGDSLVVPILIDAGGLLAGSHLLNISILSNDPFTPRLTIHCSLVVSNNGFPVARITGHQVDYFGEGYVGGGVGPSWTYIQNAGSEPLIISNVTTSSPNFQVDFNEPDTLQTSEEYFLLYGFNPVELGELQGQINIYTNDPVNPVLNVTLNGTGILSPVQMVVDQEILQEELYSGQQSIQYLTVRNEGPEDLQFFINDYGLDEYLDVSPRFGTVYPGQSIVLEVTFDARGVNSGYYEPWIVIENNDPRTYGAFFMPTTFLVKAPEVKSFSLTNFKTNTVIAPVNDEVTLDVADPNISKYTIRANMIPANRTGSVAFFLDNKLVNYDNAAPYTINSWALPVLIGGEHILRARGFEQKNGEGNGGEEMQIRVKVINSASIVNFTVVKAATGETLTSLVDGSVIDISQPGFQFINITANTNISTVRSVKFFLNGPTARVDNQFPFSISGNSTTDTFWPARPGNYVMKAIPYMMYYGWGAEGVQQNVNFKVVNGKVPSVANARSLDVSNDIDEEATEADWLIYPIPVRDDLHIKLKGSTSGNIHLSIINLQGQYLHSIEGTSELFQDYKVSTVSLGLRAGFYIIQINQTDGNRIIQKFLKE
ncbi:MAG: T9SS type A sorting domain-containing protein [Chryseolinea sp.]